MFYKINRYPAELIDVVRLPDERRLIVRPVLPQDAPLVREFFFHALSDQSRRNRFFRMVRELPPGLLEQFTQIDYCTHVALVAEIFENGSETIVGEARYVTGVDPHAAELAIAVGDEWQRRGIGRLLLLRLLAWASDQGIVLLHGQVLPSNDAMKSLAKQAGFRIFSDPHLASLLRVERSLAAGDARRGAHSPLRSGSSDIRTERPNEGS
jgi:acetyltransferase